MRRKTCTHHITETNKKPLRICKSLVRFILLLQYFCFFFHSLSGFTLFSLVNFNLFGLLHAETMYFVLHLRFNKAKQWVEFKANFWGIHSEKKETAERGNATHRAKINNFNARSKFLFFKVPCMETIFHMMILQTICFHTHSLFKLAGFS